MFEGSPFAHPAIGIAAGALLGVGLCLMGAPDVSGPGRRRAGARLTISVGGGLGAVALIGGAGLLFAGHHYRAAIVLSIVAAIALCAAMYASVLHARSLATRLEEWRFAGLLEDLQFALPLTAIVGLCVAIGPVIALAVWSAAMLSLAARVRRAANSA